MCFFPTLQRGLYQSERSKHSVSDPPLVCRGLSWLVSDAQGSLFQLGYVPFPLFSTPLLYNYGTIFLPGMVCMLVHTGGSNISEVSS